MSLYRKILSRGWFTTWKSKYLWFFGLFAALLGAGGEYGVLIRGISGDIQTELFPGFRKFYDTGIISLETFTNLKKLFVVEPFTAITIVFFWLLILVLFIFLIWLINVSQISLISNAAKVFAEKKVTFQDLVDTGVRNFWPVFGLNVLVKIIMSGCFILIGLPIILSKTQTGDIIFALLFILFIPFVMALSFVIKYAIAYIVIKKHGFSESVILGWRLFVKNWLISLEMAFTLYIINIMVFIGSSVLSFALVIPFMFLALLFYKVASFVVFGIVALLGLFLLFCFVVLIAAVLTTFQISTWTNLFIELESKGGVSKIVRVFSRK